jgi:hypothetical protein
VERKGTQVIDILALYIPVDIHIIDSYRTEIFQENMPLKIIIKNILFLKRITKYFGARVGKI